MTEAPAAAPSVAALLHRLTGCPGDFLAPPLVGARGVVSVAAVAGDTLRDRGAELPAEWVKSLAPAQADDAAENWLRACLVTCWLTADASLVPLISPDQLLDFFTGDLNRMAGLVRADRFVSDADRREELARSLLRTADVVPAGETSAQAADRLATLDSVTRTRVEGEARAAEERAREVRAALEKQRAEEAAARASRE